MNPMLGLALSGFAAIAFIWLWFAVKDKLREAKKYRKAQEAQEELKDMLLSSSRPPFSQRTGIGGNPFKNNGAICGQVRPGEWKCNCSDQSKPCTVLVGLKSTLESAEASAQITDRRGLIAAQKARKRNGN